MSEENINNTNKDTSQNTSFESMINQSFFYTNDKHLEQIDYPEILKKIRDKYPLLNPTNEDRQIKKEFVSFLTDEHFIKELLDYYDLTILDLFKILFTQHSSIFKGPYLKKLRELVKNKIYNV